MTCPTHHAADPCPFCVWAASGDPVKVRAANARAGRIAGRPPDAPPSLLKQAASFGRAVVRHVSAGAPEAPPDVVEGRRAACLGCDRYNQQADRCKACGCNLKYKTAWAMERCPLDRWPEA